MDKLKCFHREEPLPCSHVVISHFLRSSPKNEIELTFTVYSISNVAWITNTFIRSNLINTVSMLRAVVLPVTGVHH
jgi:hypothetical protein